MPGHMLASLSLALLLFSSSSVVTATDIGPDAPTPPAAGEPGDAEVGERPAPAQAHAPKDAAAAADRKVRAILGRPLPEVQFEGVAFSDVVDFLRDVSSANIFVNWRALEAAGVDRNAPVDARLRDIPFDKALTVILDSVGGKEGETAVGFVVEDGVITISTKADLALNVATTVYDVRDLLAGPGKTAADYKAVPADRRARRVEALVKLITGSVAPASWKASGGHSGDITERSGQLAVTQTPENHVAVKNLLDQMRKLAE